MGESYSAAQAAQVHGHIKALEPAFEAQCRRILGTLVNALRELPDSCSAIAEKSGDAR